MTALALRPEGRVVTHCCGGHRPAPGEASTCTCCPECVSNARRGRYSAAARRLVAHMERCLLASRRATYRRAEYAVGVAGLCDLDRATVHAVRALLLDPPVRGVLDAEALCRSHPACTPVPPGGACPGRVGRDLSPCPGTTGWTVTDRHGAQVRGCTNCCADLLQTMPAPGRLT